MEDHHHSVGNPAVSNNSITRIPLNQCRKVFVQRDYSRGLIVRFSAAFPQELQGKVEESQWQKTITELNLCYEEGEKVGPKSSLETLAGCFSCYLSHLCITSQYDKIEISLLTEPASINQSRPPAGH